MTDILQKYTTLIIGCGNIGGGFDMAREAGSQPVTHAGAYACHGGFRISACVDPDASRRRKFSEHWGITRHAEELTSLQAEAGDFDVISICSPTSLHHQHLLEAIHLRPRVIFCEKPLTLDVAYTKQIIHECSAKGIKLLTNFSRRWDYSVTEFIQQIHEGRWGAIRSIVGYYNKGILNNGSHMLELLFRIIGPMRVIGTSSVSYDFWDFDPTIAALLVTESDDLPVYLSPGNANDFAYFEIEFVCELGVVRMQEGGLSWARQGVVEDSVFPGYKILESAKNAPGRYMDSMSMAIREIYQYLKNNKPSGSEEQNTCEVQELCQKILERALKHDIHLIGAGAMRE